MGEEELQRQIDELQERIAKLQERITNLRASLEYISDRDPQAFGGASMATYVGYTDEIRRRAEKALANDDIRADLGPK